MANDYEKVTWGKNEISKPVKGPVKARNINPKVKKAAAKSKAKAQVNAAERTYSRMKAEARRKTAHQKALDKQTNPPYKRSKAADWSLPRGGTGKN